MHSCMGVIELQLVHQLPQSSLLLRSTCVLGVLAIGSATPNVADTNAMGIMPQAVRPGNVFSSSLVDRAISIDDIVITYVGKLAGKMPTANIVHCEILPFGSSTAVNNYLIYFSHCVAYFVGLTFALRP